MHSHIRAHLARLTPLPPPFDILVDVGAVSPQSESKTSDPDIVEAHEEKRDCSHLATRSPVDRRTHSCDRGIDDHEGARGYRQHTRQRPAIEGQES